MNRRVKKLGWLAVPAFILLLILVGAATASESRQQFEDRIEREQVEREQAEREEAQRRRSDNQNSTDRQPSDSDDGEGGSGDQQGQDPIIIQTDDGEIVVQLDENGNPVSVVTGDNRAPADSGRYFTPSDDGEFTAIRVTDDGQIEPVRPEDLADGDFLLEPSDGELIVVRPDGSKVALTPTEEGRLQGSEVAFDDTRSDAVVTDDRVFIESSEQFGPDFVPDPDGEPLIIGLEDGAIRIELTEDGDLVAGQGSEPGAVDLAEGEPSAIRLNDDGTLEVVPLDDIGPDDTVLVPADGGFDLVRPDDGRVEFRTGGENDGMTATEISPDGQATELEPNPDGSVTLSDGTTVGPIDFVEDGGAIERLLDRTTGLPWPWVFGAIALLAILSGGTAFYLHRNRPDDHLDLSRFAVQDIPEDEFERFLDVIRSGDDPTRSIRLAFFAVERGLAGLPPRRADETPFEWLGRVERHQPELAPTLAPICDLFAMVRFAPGQASLADRDAMIAHLRRLNQVASQAASSRRMAGV